MQRALAKSTIYIFVSNKLQNVICTWQIGNEFCQVLSHFFFWLYADEFQYPSGCTADGASLDWFISSGELKSKDFFFSSMFLCELSLEFIDEKTLISNLTNICIMNNTNNIIII